MFRYAFVSERMQWSVQSLGEKSRKWNHDFRKSSVFLSMGQGVKIAEPSSWQGFPRGPFVP